MIIYKQVSSQKELQQILELQRKNLKNVLSVSEREVDGFLTVEHTMDILQEMNDECAHIIAMEGGRLVGYALCMHPKFADSIAVLRPMYEEISRAIGGKDNYMVMGQVCVDKNYRGKGVFRNLYATMHNKLPPGFDTIITEVDGKNKRSLFAHFSVGFETLRIYHSEGREWHLIILE
ncbi:GNAT family N-acetyltransferase [Muricauda sp. JGD-17]|uniref:GNAT family N-acetyltransferase n=1 Tax=Flagellimonas ochracea TaxID=2696472 RepID=A0A964TBR4_9FLAO|nr:GNAT family N-acetyltransferase [Allomuricauda ochracea]NAY91948.1 GNAT family N-acetyltransferase [Allomuricauda ochracea]